MVSLAKLGFIAAFGQGHIANGPQAMWPWPQAAINPCMALATMLSSVNITLKY